MGVGSAAVRAADDEPFAENVKKYPLRLDVENDRYYPFDHQDVFVKYYPRTDTTHVTFNAAAGSRMIGAVAASHRNQTNLGVREVTVTLAEQSHYERGPAFSKCFDREFVFTVDGKRWIAMNAAYGREFVEGDRDESDGRPIEFGSVPGRTKIYRIVESFRTSIEFDRFRELAAGEKVSGQVCGMQFTLSSKTMAHLRDFVRLADPNGNEGMMIPIASSANPTTF
ncbi:MAG: hypothetical protein M5R36_18915 [Deltaproteobacteria bacterium]|nr:hypothetical protein [Deltaproteobacteria bacterium]